MIRLIPDLDVVRVQDTLLYGAPDCDVLRWPAENDGIVLTHDIATMVGHAAERITSDKAMPGLIAVRSDRAIGRVIEDIEILLLAGHVQEIASRIVSIPL